MITRRIWFALRHPPRKNPIFEFSLKSNRDQFSLPIIRLMTFAMGALIFATLLFLLVLSLTATEFPRLFGVIPIIFGFVLILSTTVDSGMWAMRVADGIAFHRRNRQWDLLAVTPVGELGVIWALCQGTFQRWGLLRRSLRGVRRSIIIFLLIGMFFLSQAVISQLHLQESIITGIQLSLMLGIFYFEYIHSMSCAALSGMLGGYITGKRVEAQLLGYVIFQVAQIIIYAGSILVLLLIAQLYPDRSLFTRWDLVAQTIMTAILVLMVILAREVSCRLLWTLLRRRFDEPGAWQNDLPLG